MARELNRKYIVVLALCASAILILGVVFKPSAKIPAVSAQAADALQLQRLSRDWSLRQITDFLAETVNDLSDHVAYLPEFQATGLAWGDQGTVLTTTVASAHESGEIPQNVVGSSTDGAFLLAHEELPHPLRIAPKHMGTNHPYEGWVVLIARRPDGHVFWRAGLAGGVSPVNCGDAMYHEVVFTTQLDAEFAGGAVFDLDGDFLALVARCGGRYVAVASADVEKALREGQSLESQLLRKYGMGVAPLSLAEQEYFHVTQGLLVNEVRLGGPADGAGVMAGDVITEWSHQPVQNVQDLAPLAGPIPNPDSRFALLRNGKKVALSIDFSNAQEARDNSATGGIQLDAPANGLSIRDVTPGSAAAKAGLRGGDRILHISGAKTPDAESLNRTLARQVPTFVVFQREDTQHGVLLTP